MQEEGCSRVKEKLFHSKDKARSGCTDFYGQLINLLSKHDYVASRPPPRVGIN